MNYGAFQRFEHGHPLGGGGHPLGQGKNSPGQDLAVHPQVLMPRAQGK